MNPPEPHVEELLAELLKLRAALLALRPGARLFAFWDLDGTLLRGDCSEGLHEGGRELYPGLVHLAIEDGHSPDYSGDDSGPLRCRNDYRELGERVGAWLAYPFLAQIFSGASEHDLQALAARHFDTTLRKFYFSASRTIFDGLAAVGVEQHILSASAEFFVRGAAASLALPAHRLHGIRVRTVEGKLTRELLYPVTYAEGKVTQLIEIIRAAEAETEQPVFVLAAFGNSFDTDKAFLAHVVRQSLPVGRPLAVMINAGFAPTNYRGLFRSVRQKKVVGDR
ncbi:MAG: haloacid dehalogenase-like hydrolase [Opitutaceae bacterium]